MSVAGGVSKAVDRAVVHGCEALQIFSKNANQWHGKPLDPAEVTRFRTRIEETGITPVVSHASYLINLATTFGALREQSIAAFVDELDRADALGLLGVVIHPGTCTAGTEDEGLRLIADAIRAGVQGAAAAQDDGDPRAHGRPGPHARSPVRAPGRDHPAPQRLGARRRLPRYLPSRRLRLRHRHAKRAIGRRLTRSTGSSGIERLKVFHGNDSKKPCGSRVDRHEHIGRGLRRRGAVPADPARPPFCGAADADRDGKIGRL